VLMTLGCVESGGDKVPMLPVLILDEDEIITLSVLRGDAVGGADLCE
jgi:hypothetical protein